MAANRPVNLRRSEAFGFALLAGAIQKLTAVALWGPVAGTVWAIAWASSMAIGRPALNRELSIGTRPAVLIAVAASALQVPPLGNAGSWVMLVTGAAVGLIASALRHKGLAASDTAQSQLESRR
jgi:hypothetical protein